MDPSGFADYSSGSGFGPMFLNRLFGGQGANPGGIVAHGQAPEQPQQPGLMGTIGGLLGNFGHNMGMFGQAGGAMAGGLGGSMPSAMTMGLGPLLLQRMLGQQQQPAPPDVAPQPQQPSPFGTVGQIAPAVSGQPFNPSAITTGGGGGQRLPFGIGGQLHRQSF